MFLSLYRKGFHKIAIGVVLVVYGIVATIVSGPASRVTLVIGAAEIVWGVIRLRGGVPESAREGSPWQ